jgi:hypothetical protein
VTTVPFRSWPGTRNPAIYQIQLPTKFKLVINLTTTKAPGLTVLPTLLALAYEVIERTFCSAAFDGGE